VMVFLQQYMDSSDNYYGPNDKTTNTHINTPEVVLKTLALADSSNSILRARNQAFMHDLTSSVVHKRQSAVRRTQLNDHCQLYHQLASAHFTKCRRRDHQTLMPSQRPRNKK
jgi:hypothetical protein